MKSSLTKVVAVTTVLAVVAAMYTPGFQVKWIEMLETRIGTYPVSPNA